jgi:hypothetical protein
VVPLRLEHSLEIFREQMKGTRQESRQCACFLSYFNIQPGRASVLASTAARVIEQIHIAPLLSFLINYQSMQFKR